MYMYMCNMGIYIYIYISPGALRLLPLRRREERLRQGRLVELLELLVLP